MLQSRVQAENTILLMFVPAFSSEGMEEFFEKELPYLARRFKKVELFSFKNNPPPDLEENIELSTFKLYQPYNRIRLALRYAPLLCKLFLTELKHSRFRMKYLLSPYKNLVLLLNKFNDALNFISYVSKYKNQHIICYSYWFNHWAGVCALAKHIDKDISFKLLTRIHGGDYQLGQRPEGYFPFRNIELMQIDRLLSVSAYAKKYLYEVEHFENVINDIDVAHLGVFEKGLNPDTAAEKFTLVSCSNLIPLKRVHLIAAILQHVPFEVKWIHYGEGPLMNELKAQVAKLPSNIEVKLMGWVKNEQVTDYYKQNHVDLLINVSEYEGIPVSIMEAISFGIPVMGCNICGVPEIVTDQTGYLIDKDFDPKTVAELMVQMKNDPVKSYSKRSSAKQFWDTHFNADRNYKLLPDQLLK